MSSRKSCWRASPTHSARSTWKSWTSEPTAQPGRAPVNPVLAVVCKMACRVDGQDNVGHATLTSSNAAPGFRRHSGTGDLADGRWRAAAGGEGRYGRGSGERPRRDGGG